MGFLFHFLLSAVNFILPTVNFTFLKLEHISLNTYFPHCLYCTESLLSSMIVSGVGDKSFPIEIIAKYLYRDTLIGKNIIPTSPRFLVHLFMCCRKGEIKLLVGLRVVCFLSMITKCCVSAWTGWWMLSGVTNIRWILNIMQIANVLRVMSVLQGYEYIVGYECIADYMGMTCHGYICECIVDFESIAGYEYIAGYNLLVTNILRVTIYCGLHGDELSWVH